MRKTKHHVLAGEAAKQHGVFTRSDAVAAGLSESSISDAVANGRYLQLLPAVYAIAGSRPSLRQRMAAVLKSMPAMAALSHRTAAELWGLTDRGIRVIDVVTTRWDRVRRDDVVIHESLDLIEEDVIALDGLAVTSPVRTVVDLGATAPWAVESALESGIRRQHFTHGEVEQFVKRVGRRGRRGVGVIRPLLKARRKWDAATESALEDLFRNLLDEVGLPQPVPQYVLRDRSDAFVCRADFAYPQHRIFIELDSEAHHMDRIAFRRDRAKQNTAVGLGWTVLRYTWWDLREEPYRVGTEIRGLLGSRSTPNTRSGP